MEKSRTKKLIELLTQVKKDSSIENCNTIFPKIADELLKSCKIVCDDNKYWIDEIEFYYFNNRINDDRTSSPENNRTKSVTYHRTCKAGQWYFHYSGMDLTFNSEDVVANPEDSFGGGILICSLKDEKGNLIKGPKKCYYEFFPLYVDTLNPTCYPYIVASEPRNVSILKKRVALKDSNNRLWNYQV